MKHDGWRSRVLDHIRLKLDKHQLDAVLITNQSDVRYTSGFTGSNGFCFITQTTHHIATDVRYELQALMEAPQWKILIARDSSLTDTLAAAKLHVRCKTIGIDEARVTVAQHRNLRSLFAPAKFKSAGNILSSLRSIKQPVEIGFIRKAARMADRVFDQILAELKPGVREIDIAAELRYRAARAGSEGDPFDPILVSGPRSALIHGNPSTRKLRRGDLVIIDFGCIAQGYCSDMTRTIAIGGISKEKRRIYDIVRRVQEEAITRAIAGTASKDLDAFARKAIGEAGYGKYFAHALGHGLGLDVHENPKVSVRSTARLEPGNVITIEPGIYIPGLGGVRIEDDIAVGHERNEVLTRSAKELLIL